MSLNAIDLADQKWSNLIGSFDRSWPPITDPQAALNIKCSFFGKKEVNMVPMGHYIPSCYMVFHIIMFHCLIFKKISFRLWREMILLGFSRFFGLHTNRKTPYSKNNLNWNVLPHCGPLSPGSDVVMMDNRHTSNIPQTNRSFHC